MKYKKLLCWLFGHDPIEPTSGVEVCQRCGDSVAYYLDGSQWTYRERYGVLDPLRAFAFRVRSLALPRCDQCGKLLLFRRRVCETFCSEKCFDEWIPF
jgi:hypothetical protein